MKCRGSEQISTTCTFPVIIMPICPARKPFNYSRTLSYLSIPSICSLIISQSLNQINQFPSLCHHLVFYISVSGSAQHHFFFFLYICIFFFVCLFLLGFFILIQIFCIVFKWSWSSYSAGRRICQALMLFWLTRSYFDGEVEPHRTNLFDGAQRVTYGNSDAQQRRNSLPPLSILILRVEIKESILETWLFYSPLCWFCARASASTSGWLIIVTNDLTSSLFRSTARQWNRSY